MSLVKTIDELEKMRAGGQFLARTLLTVAEAVRPGVTTGELNELALKLLRGYGCEPSFLGYGEEVGNLFPGALCTSVDNAVVHGVPSSKYKLEAGQIIGLDLGAWYKGFCTDMAITVPVGEVSAEARKLIKVTQAALFQGLKKIKAGAKLGDIGSAIQIYAEDNGFSVVRQLTGHGVGQAVHEEPAVPNFGRPGVGLALKEGMTLAIEPMINIGAPEVKVLKDGWTVVTADNSLSAHFEHTIVVTKEGCEILTDL